MGGHHVNSINGTSIDSHVQSFSIDIDYIETLGFRIIQGRSFLSNFYNLKHCMDFSGASFADINNDNEIEWISPYGIFMLNATSILDFSSINIRRSFFIKF